MRSINFAYFLITFCIVQSCGSMKDIPKTISLQNTLGVDRINETIELDHKLLGLPIDANLSLYGLKEYKTGEEQTVQHIDVDKDGEMDMLIFQPFLLKDSIKKYQVVKRTERDASITCFSRFVPERTDDYAWENNRVAFRTFGPRAQEMVEADIPGGTLASGIDAWLKKVEYPIIDKWYKKHLDETGSYHEDTGEGLDNFHVGRSRGIGGLAVETEGKYSFSKNFISWETITTGPIRTSFKLTYEAYDLNGVSVKEEKVVSLDYGSNLSKIELYITGVESVSAGLTLHDKEGEIYTDIENGWCSHWENLDDSEIGSGLVASSNNVLGFDNYLVENVDLSNLYMELKLKNHRVVYYSGFGWKKSGQFNSHMDWKNYLVDFALRINNPIQILK